MDKRELLARVRVLFQDRFELLERCVAARKERQHLRRNDTPARIRFEKAFDGRFLDGRARGQAEVDVGSGRSARPRHGERSRAVDLGGNGPRDDGRGDVDRSRRSQASLK